MRTCAMARNSQQGRFRPTSDFHEFPIPIRPAQVNQMLRLSYTTNSILALAANAAIASVVLLSNVSRAADQVLASAPGSAEAADEWSFKLSRIAPTEPEDAQRRFTMRPEVQFELVANEPLVVDPVAMAFDETGALYVVEMRDYSEQANDHLGRVRRLTDRDGDGVFDESSVFVEGLSWPTAVCCYDGGVYVAAAPDVVYLRDENGDGVADKRAVIFTGLGRSNVQGLVNSFQWGLDNRIYAAVSSSGAKLRHVAAPAGGVLDLQGRDFSFDPRTQVAEPATGGGQHGMSFNRWGERFVCSNSDHLQAIVFEERYLERNPYQSAPGPRRSIAVDGPQAEVYRTSEVEPWRVIRTKMRVSGYSPGMIEGGGRASGYFTSATGVTIDEGGLNEGGLALVADVGSNLIHRKRLIPTGVTYRGERIDKDGELVSSSDNWFRPVQMCLGPEGAVYVADMCREVIEHPLSLPPEIKEQLDLTSGRDRGRIYRIVPKGYEYQSPRMPQHASSSELVQELGSSNMWRRLTAARLIYERQDKSIVPQLEARLAGSSNPVELISVLHVLAGLVALSDRNLEAALCNPHPQVKRHALQLAESRFDDSPALVAKAASLADDPDPVVRFQLALSLGACHEANVATTLATLMRNAENADIVAAALVAAHSSAGPLLEEVVTDGHWAGGPVGQKVIGALIGQIKAQRHPADIATLVKMLRVEGEPSLTSVATATAIALGPISSNQQSVNAELALAGLAQSQRAAIDEVLPLAEEALSNDKSADADRVAAIRLVAIADLQRFQTLLVKQLADHGSDKLPRMVIDSLAKVQSPLVAQICLSAWSKMSPETREGAATLLCSRGTWARQLLDACESHQVEFTDLPNTCAATLCSFPDRSIRKRAEKIRGDSDPVDRQFAFRNYHDVLDRSGNAADGVKVFAQHCSNCHQIDGHGYAIGPNLSSMATRGGESLLYNILVPNAEIDPRFAAYTIITVDGRVLSGVVAAETANSVTLKGPKGEISTVLRVDVDEMFNSGSSLMPEGLERSIDKAAMADLLAYLQKSAHDGKSANP